MSYDKLSRLSINEKKNRITLSTASNNVRPITYNTWEFMSKEPDFTKKMRGLYYSLIGGDIQINRGVKSAFILGYKYQSRMNKNLDSGAVWADFSAHEERPCPIFDAAFNEFLVYYEKARADVKKLFTVQIGGAYISRFYRGGAATTAREYAGAIDVFTVEENRLRFKNQGEFIATEIQPNQISRNPGQEVRVRA